MSKKIAELKALRQAALTEAENFVNAGDMTGYNEKMKAVKEFNAKIEAQEAFDIEAGRYSEADSGLSAKAAKMEAEAEDEFRQTRIDRIRSTNEYTREFMNAIRESLPVARATGALRAAMTEAGGTPTGKDGGFLVPIDMETKINELSRQLVSLSKLVQVEYVGIATGSRVKDVAPTTGFSKLGGELPKNGIPMDDQPAFAQVPYSLETYGLIIPISAELVQDEDANLMSYLAKWFAKKHVITENIIILTELAKLTGVPIAAGAEIATIQGILDETLDPDIEIMARFLMNQTAFKKINALVDTTGRPLLQPDISQGPGKYLFDKHVTKMSNAHMPNNTTDNYAPGYVGDFEQYMTLYKRRGLEMASTNVGGDAWRKNGYEIRGITRLDGVVFDEDAVVKLNLATAAGTGTGDGTGEDDGTGGA